MKRINFCNEWVFSGKENTKTLVSLPHDAALAAGRDENAPSGRAGAFFKSGVYEYEKCFFVPKDWQGKTVYAEFEGVSPRAEVFLNDRKLGGCRYGYSRFRVPLAQPDYGAWNTMRVLADDSEHPNSRWYAGAGIYRPVSLLIGEAEHILADGVRITTESCAPAKITVSVGVSSATVRDEDIEVAILDQNRMAASGRGRRNTFVIADAKLWSAGSPALYQCLVTLYRGGRVIDTHMESFGIRTLEWSGSGFFVNGESVLLKGGCIHHDHGVLGAKTFEQSEWRRIRRLKEFGFNAVRSAHNPLSAAALRACDALGMYVMDEAWDTWTNPKNPYDHARDFLECFEEDLQSMVDKDYNHPSVVMYSIGNEVTEPAKPEGLELGKRLIGTLKRMDSTRPVTAGINLTLLFLSTLENNPLAAENAEKNAPSGEGMDSTAFNKMVFEMGKRMTEAAATDGADQVSSPILDALDIAGYNYAVSRYGMEGTLHPDRLVVGSETYPIDLASTWKLVEAYPYVIGDFMWTAWDYLGEAGIGAWSYDREDAGFEKGYPYLLADTGALDILGNDNAEAGLAATVWGARSRPYIGVCPVNHPGVTAAAAIWRGSNALPYWSYRGCDGNAATVEVYSDKPEAELFINGRSLGKRRTEDARAVFETVYEPGELKAVALDASGNPAGESCLVSADEHTGIAIVQEAAAHVGEIVYFDIRLAGANGEIECNADTGLSVSVTGGELLGFGSANPKTEDCFTSGHCRTYYGRCQAVVRVTEESVCIRVSGEGLADAFHVAYVRE